MEVTLYKTIEVHTSSTLDLEPKDYLYCETIEELRENIKDDLSDAEDFDFDFDVPVDSEILDTILEIPDEFIKEWKKLKLDGKN